jgi:hypothetical protein
MRRPSRSTRLTCTRHPRADGIADAGALAAQLLARLVEAEVFAAELGDVDQPLDVHGVERDEQAEAGGRRDHTAELLTQMLAHVLALEPGFHVAAGFVSAAFVGAAMQAGGLPGHQLGADLFRLFTRDLHLRGFALLDPLRELGMGLARRRQGRQVVPRLAQDGLDHTVHQQVRVTRRIGLVKWV